VGGFGTVQWIDVAEYAAVKPDAIVMDQPLRTLEVLNQTHNDQLRALLSKPGQPVSDAAFISIDRLGADVRVRFGTEYSVERIGFDQPVHTVEEATASMARLLPVTEDPVKKIT